LLIGVAAGVGGSVALRRRRAPPPARVEERVLPHAPDGAFERLAVNLVGDDRAQLILREINPRGYLRQLVGRSARQREQIADFANSAARFQGIQALG